MFIAKIKGSKCGTTIIKNVSEIKVCHDGRHLIHYFSCTENQDMVWQIPKGFTVTSQWIENAHDPQGAERGTE